MKMLRSIGENRSLIVFVVELFGILVFLLWQVSSMSVIDIPQFSYANF